MVRNEIRFWSILFSAVPALAIVLGGALGMPF